MTIAELLTYIFQNYFGYILIAISVVLAALLFEEKLRKIQKLLENRPKSAEPDSAKFEEFEEKKEKQTVVTPTPALTVKETLEKMTRKKERKDDQNEKT